MRKVLHPYLLSAVGVALVVVSFPVDGLAGNTCGVLGMAAALLAYRFRNGIPMRPATRAARARLSDALAELDAIDDGWESPAFLAAHDRIYAAEAELRWWQRIDMNITRNDGRGRS